MSKILTLVLYIYIYIYIYGQFISEIVVVFVRLIRLSIYPFQQEQW